MFELDVVSGTVTCDHYKLSKLLKHDAFAKRYSEFAVTQERHHPWGLTEKVYGASAHLTSTQTCFLSVCYFNQDIAYIHIDAAAIPNFDVEGDTAEKAWWHLQLQWAPVISQLMQSKFGKPHIVEPFPRFDEAAFLFRHVLSELEHWTYHFSWGQAGLGYISEDRSYRIWIGYGPNDW